MVKQSVKMITVSIFRMQVIDTSSSNDSTFYASYMPHECMFLSKLQPRQLLTKYPIVIYALMDYATII
jgi:hypothetical protein